MYKDHQLIGDDQLLRFARNVLRLWSKLEKPTLNSVLLVYLFTFFRLS